MVSRDRHRGRWTSEHEAALLQRPDGRRPHRGRRAGRGRDRHGAAGGIENPAFFLILLGAPALAGVALIQARRSGSTTIAGWIGAGLALYTVMVVVTFAFHFPLNEDLKDAGDPARIENLAAVPTTS